jgi:hypothetical protein
MKNEEVRKLVEQSWVHSHEEDTETEKVFRPAHYKFPPSRGRTRFQFEPDGTLVHVVPGIDDRPKAQKGRWELTQDGDLILYPESSPAKSQRLRVVSIEKDKLIVKRPG